MTDKEVKCPECGSRMVKAGARFSGRHEYQSYRCSNRDCLRSWLNTKEPYQRKQ